jgi:capsular polysaccharide biosynthesis protein/Mrp family chromosome partitioning ATPase
VEFRQYLRTLRGQWPVILLAVVLGTVAAFALTRESPAVYQSTTKLLVISRGGGNDPSQVYQGELLAKERVKTYTELVTSPAVLQGVIDRLALRDTPDGLRGRISVTQPEDTALIVVAVDAGSPRAASATAEAVADEFARYVDGVEQARARTVDLVTVTPVQAASVPTAPVSPHHLLDLLLGALAGLVLGVGLAVLREFTSGRIRDEADVARIVDVPVFSSARPPRRRHAGVRNLREPDAYLDLASVLLRLQEDRAGRPVTVLGPTADAGAAELVANVARALARSPLRVVLIAPAPTGAHGRAQDHPWPGLYDVLAGRISVRTALHPVEGEKWLCLLPSEAPAALRPALDPRQLQRLMTELHEVADVVLIDALPLDESVEGAVLAAYSDGALLVVRPNRTRRKDLARAVETLRDLSTGPTGVFLNRIPPAGRSRRRPPAPVKATPPKSEPAGDREAGSVDVG